MTSASLFGKLQERELELGRLGKHENQEKKSKGITLKVIAKEEQEEDAPEKDENFMLLVKRLGKLFRNDKKSLNYAKRKNFFRKKDGSTSTQNFTCYKCGKKGHIKMDFSKLTKKSGFKIRKETKSKIAYIASHHSDDEYEEVSNDFSLYDNYAQGSIDELLNEFKILHKMV